MSAYQGMVSAIEQRVNEVKRQNSVLPKLPDALMAEFVEVMDMPPEMCVITGLNDGMSNGMNPVDAKLAFQIAVKVPPNFGVEPFMIPITASVIGDSYRARVSNCPPVTIPFIPTIDTTHLKVLATHAAEYLLNQTKEFLQPTR
jgi:hypothetical protein